ALPAAIRADLALLRAQVALLAGDGARAAAAVATIDPRGRAADALVDARATALEAAACLARLPVDRRRAARLAIAAIRRARTAELPEAEAQARAALSAARFKEYPGRVNAPAPRALDPSANAEEPHALWAWLADVAAGAPRDEAALALARLLVQRHRAERV